MQMSDYCYCSVRWIKIRANLALQCSQQCPEHNTIQGIVIQSRPETSGSNGHQLQTKHIKDQTLGSTKELVLSLSDPHVHVSSLSWEHVRSHTNTENLLHSLSEAVNVRTNCIFTSGLIHIFNAENPLLQDMYGSDCTILIDYPQWSVKDERVSLSLCRLKAEVTSSGDVPTSFWSSCKDDLMRSLRAVSCFFSSSWVCLIWQYRFTVFQYGEK